MSASDSPQLHNIFVYGSFQEPDVTHVMLNRIPEIVSATLPGFKRFRLKGRLYPCIIPSEEGEVHGKILMGLTDEELENVDWVEGNEYERVTVEVIRLDNNEKMRVETYPWINKNDPDIGGEWDFEEWKQLHMKKFIETFKKIMELKRNPEKKRDDFVDCLSETMVFVKSDKSNAYFKRYQVKFRRRRDGKTDYRARIRLINQDKNKYNTPKYRFVVRFTNKDIVAQIESASIAGDIVKASAYAHELPRYGLTVGLTNYAAAYCTGLLLARRVLKMLEMDDEYEGNVEATGEDFSVEPTDSRRPFRALLDVGLIRTTTGNRVFGALKGALDGGLDIPHSDKRFAGFNKENKQLDAEIHRNYIYGGHVSNYMKLLAEDEPEKLQTHFSTYIKKGVEAESIEEMYKKVHAAIRADPTRKKTEKPAPKEHKRYNLKKLTYEERKNKLIERVKALNGAGGDNDNDDDDDEEED